MQMSGPPRGRLENSGLETCRSETAHSCRKALQALLGFSIALLKAVLLDGGIVAYTFVDEVARSLCFQDGAD